MEADPRAEPVAGVDRNDESVVLRLAGELDLHNAPRVRHALEEAMAEGPTRVVVDLSNVEFLDSTTIGVLLEARSQAPDSFRLAAPRAETRRALHVAGVEEYLGVYESVEQALEN